jgi:hypothetical protein
MAARGESPQHLALKHAAIAWALENGYTIAAAEIRIPRSAYRADVVALTTTLRGGPQITRSAIFECKQSRSDLIKDSRLVQKTLDRIAELTARKHTLDTLLGVHYPSLRTSDELFNDFTVPIDPVSLGHEGYSSVNKELCLLQNRLFGKTKFDRLIHYQNADVHYLVTISGLFQPHEVPSGWGHLQLEENGSLVILQAPTLCQPSPDKRLEMLISLARRATPRSVASPEPKD